MLPESVNTVESFKSVKERLYKLYRFLSDQLYTRSFLELIFDREAKHTYHTRKRPPYTEDIFVTHVV